ncbi:MAG TPA: hypothetical protein VLL74_07445 [Methanoregula sp.]|nr:hypothetical protein [Methanoregula sp.]
MRAKLKKPLLFIVIVVVGSVLVLFDIPLVILVPVLLLVGFGTLLALGSITIAEIRAAIAGLGKSGILKRLNDMKFFEKKPADAKRPAPPVLVKTAAPDARGAQPGAASHVSTFVSSVRSLGSMLRQKKKPAAKVEDINRLLDKTVSEQVAAPPPAAGAPPAPAAGGGAVAGKAPDTDDPFMSLADDEFPEGLLDGLDDDGGSIAPPPAPVEEAVFNPADFPDLEPAGPDLPAPAPDSSSPTEDIPKATGKDAGGVAGDLSAPEGMGDLQDADFDDLDGLSLDDIDFDAEPGESSGTAAPSHPHGPETPAGAAAPASDSTSVKTAWIQSDAPKDAGGTEDEIATQADMAAFAGGTSGDEDLLSSIASDVKHAKKEQDVSLLRDLKDFRAPAAEIEKELGSIYERMNMASRALKKNPPDKKGKK